MVRCHVKNSDFTGENTIHACSSHIDDFNLKEDAKNMKPVSNFYFICSLCKFYFDCLLWVGLEMKLSSQSFSFGEKDKEIWKCSAMDVEVGSEQEGSPQCCFW